MPSGTACGEGRRPGRPASAGVGPDDLGAEDRLVEPELAVELLDRRGLRTQVDDRVDAFVVLVDLVGQATLGPDVDALDLSAVLTDDVEVGVEGRGDGALVEAGVEDDHHFVGAQGRSHLLRTQAATVVPWQEGCCARRTARSRSTRPSASTGTGPTGRTAQATSAAVPDRNHRLPDGRDCRLRGIAWRP